MSQDVYPDKFDISQLIKQLIARIVGLDEMHIDVNLPLSSFGLDSAAMMGVVIELEESASKCKPFAVEPAAIFAVPTFVGATGDIKSKSLIIG